MSVSMLTFYFRKWVFTCHISNGRKGENGLGLGQVEQTLAENYVEMAIII